MDSLTTKHKTQKNTRLPFLAAREEPWSSRELQHVRKLAHRELGNRSHRRGPIREESGSTERLVRIRRTDFRMFWIVLIVFHGILVQRLQMYMY